MDCVLFFQRHFQKPTIVTARWAWIVSQIGCNTFKSVDTFTSESIISPLITFSFSRGTILNSKASDVLLPFQVCDEPHPLLIREMIKSCTTGDVDEAYKVLSHLWYMGYAAEDIITNIFRVCKNYQMSEYLKLEFIKVRFCSLHRV